MPFSSHLSFRFHPTTTGKNFQDESAEMSFSASEMSVLRVEMTMHRLRESVLYVNTEKQGSHSATLLLFCGMEL